MSFRQSLSVFLLLALLLPAIPAGAQDPAEPLQKVVYLTFDDGPKADTPELLAVLDALDVPATFFLMGASVRMYPEHARMIYEAGYPIGCHSMGHKYSYLKENKSSLDSLQKGSAQPHVYPKDLNAMKLKVPTDKYLGAFCRLVAPYFERIKTLQKEIAVSAEARDRLLPKLMSGEITV